MKFVHNGIAMTVVSGGVGAWGMTFHGVEEEHRQKIINIFRPLLPHITINDDAKIGWEADRQIMYIESDKFQTIIYMTIDGNTDLDYAMGQYFGYPKCCVEAYDEDAVQAFNTVYHDHPIRPSGYVPCSKCISDPNLVQAIDHIRTHRLAPDAFAIEEDAYERDWFPMFVLILEGSIEIRPIKGEKFMAKLENARNIDISNLETYHLAMADLLVGMDEKKKQLEAELGENAEYRSIEEMTFVTTYAFLNKLLIQIAGMRGMLKEKDLDHYIQNRLTYRQMQHSFANAINLGWRSLSDLSGV